MSILERINGHQDLVKLTENQRIRLCKEIRTFLVNHVSKTGGHLASNLGVVELTVALETVYNTNTDRLVFDVGHQSYVHKLLTGRQADFEHLRQFGGIAGFPKPSESDADAFVAGHASSSVSIALGMARARTLLKQDYDVVALIGDGAATGGMAYEGLNDAADSNEPLLIILNDNEMSIDQNVGGMSKHLSKLRTKDRYLGMKQHYRDALHNIPGGKALYHASSHVKGWIKRSILPTTMFENMGLTYLGPVDGHDVNELIRVIRIAKEMRQPVLLHVFTQKGCGYLPAEEKPSQFHGISKFDPETGKTLGSKKFTFSDAFGDAMVELAAEDETVCAITAAMPSGTGLLNFRSQYPNRLFDVGIAEEHATSMAGGLAKQGMTPVLALYSTFLQRAYDQLIQDVAMLKLHVVVAIDRAGLVGEDGETHHGVFDVGFLRQVPGMRILSPASCAELKQMLRWAVKDCSDPVAVRYPRGSDGQYVQSAWNPNETVVVERQGKDVAIVTYGNMINNALASADLLAAQGVSISVIRLTQLAPIDFAGMESALSGIKHVIVAEEASAGIHEAVAWELGKEYSVSCIDLGKGFVTHGSIAQLHKQFGMDAASMAQKVQEVLQNEN